MKVAWLFNHYALPPGEPGGNRHYYLARNLLNHNWKTYIIASDVNYLTHKKILKCKHDFFKQIIDRITFIWVKVPISKGNGIMRILSMIFYTLKVLSPSCTRKLPFPNLIVGSSVHPFAALSACIIANRLNVPFIFEVRALWPETLVAYKKIKQNGIICSLLRILEKHLYTNASKIIVTLPNASEYITSLGINKNKIAWVSNGVEIDLYKYVTLKEDNPNIFTLVYLGSHGQSNDLDILLDAMRIIQKNKISKKRICLKLIGDGPLKESLINKVKSKKISDVSFHTPVQKNDIPKVTSCADAFVILVPRLPELYKYGISMNKIFDYLACKRPTLIATDYYPNPISESGAGYSVCSGDPASLANAINRLALLSNKERNQMAIDGFEYLKQNHCFNFLSRKLASVFDNCILSK